MADDKDTVAEGGAAGGDQANNDVWSCNHFPGHNAKKLNNLIDAYINDLLDVYNGNEIIIVNIEIHSVFSCYPLLKQWLPAIEAPQSQAGNLANFWVGSHFQRILLRNMLLVYRGEWYVYYMYFY